MKLIQNLNDIPKSATSQIVVIGNFDGLHKGHRALIERASHIANDQGREVVLLTFEPHPRMLFRPDDPPFRMTPFHLKMKKISELGIKTVISLPFDWNFASQSAEDFVKNVLISALDAAHIVVGEDFCFGQLRKGTPDTIRSFGIDVTGVAPVLSDEHEKFSSSIIRQKLRQGDISAANKLLGWEWEINGEVIKGEQRGRELGYPTANVALKDTLHPAYGIYACFVQIEGEKEWLPSATNIGIRPMFEVPIGQVEAHILNGFDRDIYGKILRIKPVVRLRGEAKFDGLDALCVQIETDCINALNILDKKRAA